MHRANSFSFLMVFIFINIFFFFFFRIRTRTNTCPTKNVFQKRRISKAVVGSEARIYQYLCTEMVIMVGDCDMRLQPGKILLFPSYGFVFSNNLGCTRIEIDVFSTHRSWHMFNFCGNKWLKKTLVHRRCTTEVWRPSTRY